jgi:SAM-dependent methyltransferase
MRDWLSFWNSPNRIYVNDLHRDVHYRDIALQIRALVPSPGATVVDYGSGEATSANLVADAAGRLILSDGAPNVRAKLAARFKDNPKIDVLSPEEVALLAPGSVDLIVLNSVAQYLDPAELDELLRQFHRLLAPAGRLAVGDVLPPNSSVVTEAVAFLKFAGRNGFVGPALAGMVRTVFSGYWGLRTRLGLTAYTEADMLATLGKAGFAAYRRYPNIEHNQERMTFVATPTAAARPR